jgi:hypothetical protein
MQVTMNLMPEWRVSGVISSFENPALRRFGKAFDLSS